MSTDAKVAITIFAVAMVGTLGLGIAAARGRDANLAEWSVGGRSFGVILTWVLLAGECYTSFSYLGAAGWAYGYGAPILYLVGYMATGYATVYLFAPMVWSYAKRHNLISVSDILAHRFKSPKFGIVIAAVATIALLPYIQLQIQGMGLVVSAMSYGEIGLKTAFVIGFVVSAGFVLISGLRGSAWVSVLKDVLVILTIAFLAIYLPLKLFGGYGELFTRLRDRAPRVADAARQRVARPRRAVVHVHLHPQRRHVHRVPELRGRLPGLQEPEHDPPQRDLPADVLAAAARAGDARHGRAVRGPEPRDQRSRAADDGHAGAAGVGRRRSSASPARSARSSRWPCSCSASARCGGRRASPARGWSWSRPASPRWPARCSSRTRWCV